MTTLQEIAAAIVMLTRAGAVFRFIFCMVRLSGSEEQAGMYKKRAKNTVIFYILAELAWQLKDLLLSYYK